MRNELRNQWKLYEKESLCKIRKVYVTGFLDCTPAYLCESFRVHDDNGPKDEIGFFFMYCVTLRNIITKADASRVN